jgi:hypothetical protein
MVTTRRVRSQPHRRQPVGSRPPTTREAAARFRRYVVFLCDADRTPLLDAARLLPNEDLVKLSRASVMRLCLRGWGVDQPLMSTKQIPRPRRPRSRFLEPECVQTCSLVVGRVKLNDRGFSRSRNPGAAQHISTDAGKNATSRFSHDRKAAEIISWNLDFRWRQFKISGALD